MAGLVVLLALGATSWVMAGGWAARREASPTSYSPPAHLARFDPVRLTATARQLRLVVNDDERVHHALTLAAHHHAPFLAPAATGRRDAPTLVLVPRTRPYGLDNVVAHVPSAFTRTGSGAVVLRYPLLVAPGATLVIDSRTVPVLLLLSDKGRYATITAVLAKLDLRGHPGRPLMVSSFDPASGGPDTTESDGRAYVQSRGGTMTVRATGLSYLGFAVGRSSGVGWLGEGSSPPAGGAAWSTFRHNYVGASVFAGRGLVVTRSSFTDNDVYGLDVHEGTAGSVVADSLAARNGRHGFVISRGCRGNLLRDDESYDNGAAGFVIDDGHVAQDGNPRHAVAVPSDENRLLKVSSHDNGSVGVSVEGGTANSLESSIIDNNRYGVWVKNAAASTLVTGDTVTRSLRTGVRLFPGTRATDLTRTTVSGAAIGVSADHAQTTVVTDVRVTDAEQTGIRFRGAAADDVLTGVTVSGLGPRAVDARGSALSPTQRTAIDDSGWKIRHSPTTPLRYMTRHTNLLAWVPIVVLPVLFWAPSRRRTRRSSVLPGVPA